MAVPKIAYRLDDYTKAGFAASVKAHDEIFAKLGATGVQPQPGRRRARATSSAPRGWATTPQDARWSIATCGATTTPTCSSSGRAVFPTSATANPTLTIAALALRAVEAVKAAVRA